jgi:uncharacterized protein YndB with AHSA1/START domain
MARYQFSIHVAAPIELAFDLWTDLGRMREWVEGVTKVGEVSGPIDRAGTHYTVWIGGFRSPTEVIEAERPYRFATRFGNRLLRGTNRATFEPEGEGTRLTETFETEGVVAAVTAWLFGHGSYRGSFRGELEAFARLAAAEAHAAGNEGP